ncbi:MAG: serine/threonine-protein kinase, partial [Dehalococcoidia bacterium]
MFGPYLLVRQIGRGGMGQVFHALDTRLSSRPVALKILLPEAAKDAEFTARFRRESEIIAQLRNPHVIPVHHHGEIDGQLFIDMRLVEGADLGGVLEQGPLHPARAADIVRQVASALDAAHTAGLIHRDVKPTNVMLDDHGRFAYLVDFGIARALTSIKVTTTGKLIGTPAYMAPEQWCDETLDHRVDIYALGCLLHECLTGQAPYRGTDYAAVMYQHLQGTPPRPSALVAALPRALDGVVATALAKDPNQRFPTAGALAAATAAALTSSEPRMNAATPTRRATRPLQAASNPPAGRQDPVRAEHRSGHTNTLPALPDARAGSRKRVHHLVLRVVVVILIGLAAGAYVLLRGPGQGSNNLLATVLAGTAPTRAVVSPDGSRAYVLSSRSASNLAAQKELQTFDTSNQQTITTV